MPSLNISLADILGLADDEINKTQNAAPLPEAQICTLNEVKDRYLAGNTFKVGDIVTPCKGGVYKDRGVPHMVIEVADTPLRNTKCSSGSCDFGARLDIRVVCVKGGHVLPYWMESFQVEPWIPQAKNSVN